MKVGVCAGGVVLLGILGCTSFTTSTNEADAGAGASSGQPLTDAAFTDSSSSSSSSGSSGIPDAGASSSGQAPVLTEFQAEMLAAINEVRRTATPTPNPALVPLEWDTAEAARLQAWADGCVHGAPGTETGHATSWGAAEQGAGSEPVMDFLLQSRAQYDYATNDCDGPAQCASYKAMVQRSVTKVGCAISTCTNDPPSGIDSALWHLFACGYSEFTDPTQRPYE